MGALRVGGTLDFDGGGHHPKAKEALGIEGAVYGYPLASKTLVLMYDPTRIERPPQDTDALIEMAKAHTGDGRYGLVYQATAGYSHAPWMHAFGAHVTAMNSARLDDEAHVRALAFSRLLGAESGIMPKSPNYELMATLYNEGKAAFIISGPSVCGGHHAAHCCCTASDCVASQCPGASIFDHRSRLCGPERKK